MFVDIVLSKSDWAVLKIVQKRLSGFCAKMSKLSHEMVYKIKLITRSPFNDKQTRLMKTLRRVNIAEHI